MLGLRASEACAADITDLRYETGYELLHVISKGAKPADIPLPIPVPRAVREAIDSRARGVRVRSEKRRYEVSAVVVSLARVATSSPAGSSRARRSASPPRYQP